MSVFARRVTGGSCDHHGFAAMEAANDRHDARELAFERRQADFFKDECEEFDAIHWLGFADDGDCKLGGLYGLFEAKTSAEAWAALVEWKQRAADAYAEHMEATADL